MDRDIIQRYKLSATKKQNSRGREQLYKEKGIMKYNDHEQNYRRLRDKVTKELQDSDKYAQYLNHDLLGEYVIVPKRNMETLRQYIRSVMWEFSFVACIGLGLAFILFKIFGE